jgi:CheY-like chemotaxis protein
MAVLDVADTGPGISAQDLPRVIEPMFTTKATRGHRGLGLTIAHSIAREHGGWLDVRSRPGEGATCTLRLPLPTAVDSERPRSLTPVFTEAIEGSPRTVLLVEDEMTLRTTISRYLRGQGYTVDLASNGAAALELIGKRHYDLILLDLRMPGMTGDDVYRTVERTRPAQVLHVVFMTGDLHSESAAQFVRNTGRPVLAKPFTLADLSSRLTEYFQVG